MNTGLSLGLLFLGNFLGQQVWAVSEPAKAEIKVYSVWLASGADCKSPKKICETDGTAIDLMASPDLCRGVQISKGKYECMIIEMSDQIKFIPNSDAVNYVGGVCKAGETYSYDLCNEPMLTQNPETDACTGCSGTVGQVTQVEDRVFLYLHTSTKLTQGLQIFLKPEAKSDTSRGSQLALAIDVGSNSPGNSLQI